jgi:glucose/arabinose dehydrogenase/mono/diheme cytochrome c family protein
MRSASLVLLPAGLLAGLLLTAHADTRAPARDNPAFRLDRRVPWTTSHVAGSPEPPHPYRAVRAFPKLKVSAPIGIARIPDSDQLLLIHQHWPWGGQGRILRFKDDDAVDKYEVFLEVDGIAYGVTFHPRFKDNGYLYVGMNGPYTGDNKKCKVLRYTLDRKTHRVVPGSQKVIIEWKSNGHNGADLSFGLDGMLYVSSGDGTSDSDPDLAGQDLTRLRSKVLRLDVDHPEGEPGGVSPRRNYGVPKDNPFVGQKGIVPETWAYGFRNPWRLHIDPKSGDLWVGNNGQDLWEQIYLVQKGANYGWSVIEGEAPFYPNRKAGPHPISKPIANHHHSEARSLTGGVVYHGDKLPGLRGAYLYGDFSTGRIWGIRHQKGKVTWHQELTDTPYQITGFGIDTKGELLFTDHGGGIYRLEEAPKEKDPPVFPTRLSETGLFSSVKGHVVQAGLIPYSVNAPLWSDGAFKERFIAIPGEGQIDFVPSRGWNFPDGSVLVKTFALDRTAGDSATRQRIETRLIVRQQGEWAGYTYAWNDEQTEATLVGKNGVDRSYKIRDPNTPGGERTQVWHYPSRAECMVCHSRAANYVLGPSTAQMNKVHDYGSARVNQLEALERLGVFRVNLAEHVGEVKGLARNLLGDVRRVPGLALEPFTPFLPQTPRVVRQFTGEVKALADRGVARVQEELYRPLDWAETTLKNQVRYGTRLPKRTDEYRALVDPSDRSKSLEARARSYLHANCAQCHVEAGGGNALMELESHQPRAGMRVVGVKPQHDTFGVEGAKLIEPGHPEKSVLYLRVSRRGQGQMPPLASAEVDREAVQLIHDWIKSLK